MKTSDEIRAEIIRLSRELAEAESKEDSVLDSEFGSPFEALEVRAAEIGDGVAQEILSQRAILINEQPAPTSPCPDCERCCSLKRVRKRCLQTIRGEIEIPEPEYHCKQCRRSFFPSEPLDRS